MSYEMIALSMFGAMMFLLLTGQRVFACIGAVAVISALALWGDGGAEHAFNAAIKLMHWYPLLTLPLFIYMGYMLSESGIADDLYQAFHVWFGPVSGGLAIGTIGLMVMISAMNGLSVAGMAIGATIAMPELLRRDSGGVEPWHPGAALGGAGALWHDRAGAGGAIVAGGRDPGADDGDDVHHLHLCAVQD
jgi:TRAP-type mannitol/chloroaromatic compound transport system permease large subunit